MQPANPLNSRLLQQPVRAKDLDLSDAAAAAQFEGSIEEMMRILAKAQIPVAKINRAIDQTLDAATDHKLQSMRVSDRVWHRSRSASDVETLIQRLTQLAKAIAKLPPSARGRLNEIVARYSEQFFDTEIFVSLIHDVAATLPNLAPRNLREMHWTSLISR
jgi:hypothetical protein